MDRYQSTDSSILCHFIGLADSHITHPHWSQVFTLSLLSRPRFSFSLQSLGAAWRLGMGVRRGLVSPRLFWGRVSRCLWGEAARLLLSSVLCSVQCLVTAPLSLTDDYCGPNTCDPGSRTEILHTGQADFWPIFTRLKSIKIFVLVFAYPKTQVFKASKFKA